MVYIMSDFFISFVLIWGNDFLSYPFYSTISFLPLGLICQFEPLFLQRESILEKRSVLDPFTFLEYNLLITNPFNDTIT
jgi:hypothetical protein